MCEGEGLNCGGQAGIVQNSSPGSQAREISDTGNSLVQTSAKRGHASLAAPQGTPLPVPCLPPAPPRPSQAFQVTVTESQGSASGILGLPPLCGLLPLTAIANASLFYLGAPNTWVIKTWLVGGGSWRVWGEILHVTPSYRHELHS